MKKTIILLLALFTIAPTFSQSIAFEKDSWNKTLIKASKENKIIFVDAYTTWCGPCKMMDRNVFVNDTVADFFNEHFINVKMDMGKKEAKVLKEHKVRAYPSFLFINGAGELVHRSCGYKKAKDFVELGKTALDDKNRFGTLQKEFENGNRSSEFILRYVLALKNASIGTKTIIDDYLSSQSLESLKNNSDNFKILSHHNLLDINSKEFNYLLDDRNAFYEIYGEESTNEIIQNTFGRKIYSIINSKKPDNEAYNQIRKEALKTEVDKIERMVCFFDLRFHSNTENWTDYTKSAILFMDKFSSDKWNTLNDIAYTVYEHNTDREILEKALKWAKLSMDIHSNFFNTDTYAVILYALRRTDEAIEYEEIAIRYAKKNNPKIMKEFQQTLKKMKAGESLK